MTPERMYQFGAEKLATEELFGLILGTNRPWHAVRGVAHDLLAKAGGSLRRLAEMATNELCTVHDMGPVRAARLRAAIELSRRCFDEPSEDRPRVRSPGDVVAILGPQLHRLTTCECHLVVLDSQNGISRTVLLSRGLACGIGMNRKAVFRAAIVRFAASAILVHNHPGGDPSPSREDRTLTMELATVGRPLDIRLSDHVIIGRHSYMSFLEEQLL